MKAPLAHSALAAAIAAGMLGACAPETRIIRRTAPLAGLPNAQTGMPNVQDTSNAPPQGEEKIVIEGPGGSKRLIARAPRHLMSHIVTTLDNNERSLFVEQVLSDHIKRMYNVRGEAPDNAFDLLLAARQDIQNLFDAMPNAENTPGVHTRMLEPGMMRIQVVGIAAEDLKWTAMDIIFERGNWRLVWFGNPPLPRRPQ